MSIFVYQHIKNFTQYRLGAVSLCGLERLMESLDLENKGLVEALGIEEGEIYEARYNLLGAFEVLNQIYIRLENEAKEKEGRGKND